MMPTPATATTTDPSGALGAAWLQRDLFPFHDRFVDILGHRLHYVDEGDGPALLLVHGNPTWSFLYRDVIRELRGRFRCIAPDLPGFGLSQPAAGFDFRPASQARVLEASASASDVASKRCFPAM